MFADERRKTILELVRNNGAVAIKELARTVQTSEVTVRRDLRLLEGEGLLDRRHGGAVAPGGLSREASYSQKSHVAGDEKAAIGERAAAFVNEGDAIAVGAGSTTQAFARRLMRFSDLTVITNSLLVAYALAPSRGVDVIVTGGSLRGSIFALVGSAAEHSLDGVRTSKVFISGNGLSVERGLSTPNLLVAGVDRALVNTAEEVFVLADDSKIGLETMVQTVPVSRMDHLITNMMADDDASSGQLTNLREVGVQVHEVPVTGTSGSQTAPA